MERTFKIALIGIGYWGSKLKRYINENENFELKYICNSKSDLATVWNDSEVSAVVIAIPNSTHYSIVKNALLSRKHVFSEKPLTLKAEECEELKQISRKYNLSIVTDYIYTFSVALNKAVELINAGQIGKVLGCELIHKRLGRFGGGSCYWLLASHMLSILDMFVSLNDLHFNKFDIVTLDKEIETGIIFFDGYIRGNISVSLNSPVKETKVTFYGDKGTLFYTPLRQLALESTCYEHRNWTISSELLQKSLSYSQDESNNLRLAIKYFGETLSGLKRDNIECAISVTNILEKLSC